MSKTNEGKQQMHMKSSSHPNMGLTGCFFFLQFKAGGGAG
jgi:hypothetical protein